MTIVTAKDILTMHEPGLLFTGLNTLDQEYKSLAKKWHPDKHGCTKEASDVMANINILYAKAKELAASGSWFGPNNIVVTDINNKQHSISFKVKHTFELGSMYIGNNIIVYAVKKEFEDLFDNAVKVINSFKYSTKEMEEEFARCLPKILDTFQTKEILYLVVSKTPDVFLLKDILNHFSGRMDGRHVAWIINRLYNILCYTDHLGLSHNAISLDTYFISPEFHSGLLLGGWWYAVPHGAKLISVPSTTYELLPPVVKSSKVGHISTDLELIRALGRELLGDRNGTKLLSLNEATLGPIINWLRGVASSTSNKVVTDYTKWEEVLLQVFGPRKFVKLKIGKIY